MSAAASSGFQRGETDQVFTIMVEVTVCDQLPFADLERALLCEAVEVLGLAARQSADIRGQRYAKKFAGD